MLPKYFIIKRDTTNPLWEKYIKWMNKKYEENFNWNSYSYYWFDWEYACWDYKKFFKNNPKLITLQEWNKAINGNSFEIWEQVWASNVSKELAREELETDNYKYFYRWKVDDRFIAKDDDWNYICRKYICKISKVHSITIDWKTIELSEESYKALKESLKD